MWIGNQGLDESDTEPAASILKIAERIAILMGFQYSSAFKQGSLHMTNFLMKAPNRKKSVLSGARLAQFKMCLHGMTSG